MSLSVTPDVAGVTGAAYTVGFKASAAGALVAGSGTITVTAAPGTKLPNCALVTDLATNASIDSCDGDAAPAATMTVTTQVAVAAGDQVRVVFTGATNTDVAGLHTLEVSTSKGSAGSATYRLVPRGGAVSDVSVSVAPNVAGASRAAYTVGFKASASGALVAGSGTITVTAAPRDQVAQLRPGNRPRH